MILRSRVAIPGDPSDSTKFLIAQVTVDGKEQYTKPTVYLASHVLPPFTLQTSDSQLFFKSEYAARAQASTRPTAK